MNAESDAEPGDEAAVLETETPEPTGEQPAPEPQAEPAPEGEAEPEGEKRVPWFQKRINEITLARRAAEQARDQLMRENEALRALNMAPKPEGAPQTAETPKGAPQSPQDFEAAVTARAAEMRQTDDFNRQANDVYQKGLTTFPGKFETAIANLQAAGVLSADNRTFTEAAMATEAPEHVLFELGNKPEEAMRLAALPPTQLAIALDRMARDLKAPAARISGAPAPVTPIAGARVAKQFDAYDTKATDTAAWMREREKQVAARKVAR